MTGEIIQKRLADNLKTLRKNKFTQETLAEAAGISWQMMNNIEGCRRWPSQDTLAKLATALNVDVEQLFATEILDAAECKDLNEKIKSKIINKIKETLDEMK